MADGKVTIDVLMNTKSFMSDRERVNNLMKTLGADAGNQMDESFANNANKVKVAAEQTHSKVKSEFANPIETKLVAKAEEAGITNFKQLLNRVPKQARTELMAKAEKGEAIDWENTMRKMPRSVTTHMKLDKGQASEGLNALKKQSESTKHSFSHLKEIVAGTFLGGAIQAGVQGLVIGLKNAAKAGMEYNKEQDTMKTVWTALTTEAPKDGKELVDYINSLSQHSIYAADTINRMSQSFYHVHSNVEETKRWTNSFVALGSTLHMSNDALAESGEQFAKIVAGGKASAEDMSVMINRFPMFGEALQKATGKSMKQLYAMSAAGKLSAKQFTEALDYLGKKYKDGTAEAMTSFQGMSMYIKSRWSVLTGSIMASSFKMSKGVAKDMRNLLSDDMMKKYAAMASGAISTVMAWFVKLIKYVDGHKDTIVDIIGNLGKILGIIGKTVWKTFSDIIYDIANMFGLVGKKAQDSKDPLDKIDDALKNLSKNQELIENLTKAFIAMFALKKGLEFIGMLSSLRKSLIETAAVSKMVDLLGGGVTGGGGKAVTQTVAKEAGGTAGSSKAFGRLFSKGGATSTAELEAASGLGGGSKLLSGVLGAAKSTAGLSAIASLPELLGTTRKTAGEHVGGYIGSTGGSIAGAAVGSLLGPVGTLAGGALGGLAGSTIGKSLGKDIQKGLDANKPKIHVIKPGKIKLDVSTDTRKVESNLKSYQKKLSKKVIVKMAADPSSYAKTKTETDKLFNGMRASVDKYYKNKESKSKQDLDKLVKNGSMTQAEENKILKVQQASDAKAAKSKKQTISKMQADTSDYYSKVKKIENGGTKNLELIALKYGRNSKKYEKEKNKELASAHKAYISKYTADEYKLNTTVSKSVEKGAKEQKSILQKLLKDRGKLNLKDLKATQENADKKYNAAVRPARKTRNDVIDSAEDQYKSTKKTADHEYYDLHAISKKQHDDIVSKAKRQRDETSDAARDQYKKVTKHATDQHRSVTNEIEHQRKEATKKQQDQEADSIAAATGQSKEVVRHQMRQANSSMSAADKQGSGLHGIWKGITSFFNNLVKGFGIKPINVGAYPSGYTPVSMGAYASGGTATSSQALVGEGGVEARISKSSGRVDFIGTNGAEVVDMQPGDQILNASDTAQLFNGGLGRTLPGYASGTIDVAGFLKKAKNGAASMFENISETASDAISKITDPVKTMTDIANKIFNPGKTEGVGSIGHDLGKAFVNRPIKAMADVISKIISSIADNGDDDGAGSLAPHFGSPFKESSGYGPRAGGFHKGIDFAAPLGTPIPAQYGGTVVQAGPASGFGNWVVIKPSGASVDTIYGHMRRMKVKTGQHVKAGQIIAWVGSEGQSSGPHVHYELRAGLGGKSYNPMTYGASAGNPSGHSVNRWRPYVARALKANGFAATASQVAAWMKVIRRESNGDPSVINTWDPNAKAGHPSKGLVQTIQPTFDAYKFRGHNNPLNGYDDLLAGIHYMKAKYGSGSSAFSTVSGPMGYDSGGRVMKKQLAWLAENNPEYVVNPERDSADSLIVEAARARAAKAPNGLIAKAMRVVGTAKAGIQRTAPSFASKGVAQAEGQAVGNQAIGGNMTISVQLDSNTIARATYPKISILRNQEIQLKGQTTGNTYAY